MADPFSKFPPTIDGPVSNADEITPDDGSDLTNSTRALYVGGSGNITVDMVDAGANVTFTAIPAGQKSLIRETDGKVLTSVGNGWHPVQNSQAFDFFNEFVDRGEMEMHTAGSLMGGQIVWALAKVGEKFSVFGQDEVESHFLFSNPHMYGKSIDVRFTPIRVVCNNTLTLSLKEKSSNAIKLSHRKAFSEEAVKEMMGIASRKLTTYKEMAEFLGSRTPTQDTIKKYFGDLLGVSKRDSNQLTPTGERALELLETQPGHEFASGSMWQAFNAVTYMTDHAMGRSNDSRMTSAWFGANQRLKTKALETALEYAEAA